jgi:hypothetical protein
MLKLVDTLIDLRQGLKLPVHEPAHRFGQLHIDGGSLPDKGLEPCLPPSTQHNTKLVQQPA